MCASTDSTERVPPGLPRLEPRNRPHRKPPVRFGLVLLSAACVFAGCLAPSTKAPPSPTFEDAGDFRFRAIPEVALFADVGNRTRLNSSMLAEATDFLNQNLRLPRDIPVEQARCGVPNAFWDPVNGSITMCLELGTFLFPHIRANLGGALQGQVDDPKELDTISTRLAVNAQRFIYYHEVAHALVGVLQLPITGREEDVADQFAAWMLLRDESQGQSKVYNMSWGQEMAIGGAAAFLAFSQASNASKLADLNWAEVHSFNIVRSYNILCWVHGSDPVRTAFLTEPSTQPGRLFLPPERAIWCDYEWRRIDYGLSTLLAAYLQPVT